MKEHMKKFGDYYWYTFFACCYFVFTLFFLKNGDNVASVVTVCLSFISAMLTIIMLTEKEKKIIELKDNIKIMIKIDKNNEKLIDILELELRHVIAARRK